MVIIIPEIKLNTNILSEDNDRIFGRGPISENFVFQFQKSQVNPQIK